MKLVLTAGFDKSLPSLLMAERLRRDGHTVSGVVVVSPYSIQRVRDMLLSRGVAGVKKAFIKMLKGVESAGQSRPAPLLELKQLHQLESSSLKDWCRKHDVAYHVVNSINDAEAVAAVQQASADMLVYGGGGILREALIESVGGWVINPHAGPLPEIRGMNAIEWATLLGERQNVTIHLIDSGIDTGRLIGEIAVPVKRGDDIHTLRTKAVASGVCALTDTLKNISEPENIETYDNLGEAVARQCYPMSRPLYELLTIKLNQLD